MVEGDEKGSGCGERVSGDGYRRGESWPINLRPAKLLRYGRECYVQTPAAPGRGLLRSSQFGSGDVHLAVADRKGIERHVQNLR